MTFASNVKNVILLLSTLGLCVGCLRSSHDVLDLEPWSNEERKSWYTATQGSRLIPAIWFDSLEQVDSDQPFNQLSNLSSFGFLELPEPFDHSRPIGFAEDRQDESSLKITSNHWYDSQSNDEKEAELWVGLNCSACHTSKIAYQGNELLIDGGPSLLDFQSFIESLDIAMEATRSNPDKWDRFAAKVLEGKDSATNQQLLKDSVNTYLTWQQRTEQMNETDMRYGHGRLDAVGHILNKTLMFVDSEVTTGNPSNAPVSYPFLWNIWRQEKVQWNGVARNSRIKLPGEPYEYGALGRNTGEVLGVFGEVVITEQNGLADQVAGFESSVKIRNLARMERLVKALKPPPWPKFFPPIDNEKAQKGEKLYADHCAKCHLPKDAWQDSLKSEVMVTFEETLKGNPKNLTDIWMACNAYVYEGNSGKLEGATDNDGNKIGKRAPVVNMLATSVRGSLFGNKEETIKSALESFFGIRRPPVVDTGVELADARAEERRLCLEATGVEILGYKARPLDGIWATAPYLHNGSVSSLYELLLPAADRSKSFWVGNREYDPVNVGYVATELGSYPGFLLRAFNDDDKVIPGNSNAGHEYSAESFTDEDRWALVEYMKRL